MYKEEFKTTEDIANFFSKKIKTGNTIAKIIKEEGVKLRPAKRRIIIDKENFFSNIDTEYKAYILGLIIADGCIINMKDRDKANRQNLLSITLKNNDRYMLKEIKTIMGIKSRKIVDSRNESILSVASDIIVNDLKKYGVINKKTFKTYLPAVNKRLEPHLIRGIFDGDGTVYIRENKYLTFGFYGNHTIVNDIKILLEKELDLANNTIFDKETVSFIYYGSRKDAKKFYNYIYNSSNIFLKRKKEKFETILNPS